MGSTGGAAIRQDEKPGGTLKAWGTVIRSHPKVLILPAVLLVVGITLGVVLVHEVADNQSQNARENAIHIASQATASLRLQLLGLFYPVVAMATLLESGMGKNYTMVHQAFPMIASRLLGSVDKPDPNMMLQLAPNALMTDIYPLNDFTRTGLGLDFLGLSSKRAQTLKNINKTQLVVEGPIRFVEGYLAISITKMVYLDNVPPEDTFGIPVPLSPYCPPNICWKEATKTKFWGIVFGAIPLDALLSHQGGLENLVSQGFDYVIMQPAINLPATPGKGDQVVLAQSSRDPRDPVNVTMDILSDLVDYSGFPPWMLYVSPSKGWQVTWEAPLYAVVVILSVLLSGLLLALMVSRLEKKTLLYSLVPEKMVKELRARRFSTAPAHDVFAISTPAEVLLVLLSDCLNGVLPQPMTCIQLRGALLSLQDIYRPSDLSEELRAAHIEDDVALNLIATLQGREHSMGGDWEQMRGAGGGGRRGSQEYDGRNHSAASWHQSSSGFEDLQVALTALMVEPDFHGRGDCGSGNGNGLTPKHSASSVTRKVIAFRAPQPPGLALPPAPHHAPRATSAAYHRRSTGVDVCDGEVCVEARARTTPSPTPGSPARRRSSFALHVLNKVASACGSVDQEPQPRTPSTTLLESSQQQGQQGQGQQGQLGQWQQGQGQPGHAGQHQPPCQPERASSSPGLVASGGTQRQRSTLSLPPVVTQPMYLELRGLLDEAFTSWTFDSFALEAASHGHPLSTLVFFTLHQTGLMQQLCLPPAKVASFAQTLESLYLDNPYHNRIHAADVVQTMHITCMRAGFMHSYMDPIRHLACILAAAAHDVEHVGLTNDFLINTDDRLAVRYNDRSPMENHHLATFFNVLKQPQHNFVSHLSKDVQRLLRKVIIELVLGTDMTQHLTIISQFKSVHQGAAASPKAHPRSGELGSSGASGPLNQGAAPGPMFVDEKERLLALQMALKVADLGSLAETTEVHCRWVAGLTEEFFLQGDKEREAGLPISPLFDRSLHRGLPSSQVGFFNFVALPLFTSFISVFADAQPFLDRAMVNYRYWKDASAAAPAPRTPAPQPPDSGTLPSPHTHGDMEQGLPSQPLAPQSA